MHRIEFKIDIHNSKKNIFFNFLKTNKASKLYEDRLINSIYFDNNRFEMYHDSNEGLSPRKKIRLRFYGDKNQLDKQKELLLEKKYTVLSGRSKTSKKVRDFDNQLKYGILDSKYGICYPRTVVSYLRSYYVCRDFRITLDTNINFRSFNSENSILNSVSIDDIIIEIKTNDITKSDDLKKTFPFSEIRFSKYCKSVEYLYRI
jgi:SPX domain protein involved in polyphosphate accumulation